MPPELRAEGAVLTEGDSISGLFGNVAAEISVGSTLPQLSQNFILAQRCHGLVGLSTGYFQIFSASMQQAITKATRKAQTP